jgi:hypothetical protein
MLNRSKILLAAWSDYRIRRLAIWAAGDDAGRSFIRAIFAKALTAAWARARREAADAARRAVEYRGPVTTLMGAVNLLDAVQTARRAAELRSEMVWQEMGDRIDWTIYRAASAELDVITA